MRRRRVIVVTDPMCSWCWGMSSSVEEAAHALRNEVDFDLLLGGINTHGTQPVGAYGRRHLLHIWREVHATTGQIFKNAIPEGLVYNSTLPCIALEAVRQRSGSPPFGFLHRLQQCLFVEGVNINNPVLLDRLAEEFGWESGELAQALRDPDLIEAVLGQFDSSRNYGTNALPNVLWEVDGMRKLLFGGYADSSTMIQLVRDVFARIDG